MMRSRWRSARGPPRPQIRVATWPILQACSQRQRAPASLLKPPRSAQPRRRPSRRTRSRRRRGRTRRRGPLSPRSARAWRGASRQTVGEVGAEMSGRRWQFYSTLPPRMAMRPRQQRPALLQPAGSIRRSRRLRRTLYIQRRPAQHLRPEYPALLWPAGGTSRCHRPRTIRWLFQPCRAVRGQ